MTKISSKGQIVIPKDMRKGLKEGDKLVVMRSGNEFILKSEKSFSKKFLEDLEFSRRTEEAQKRVDRGEYTEMSKEDFLREIKNW